MEVVAGDQRTSPILLHYFAASFLDTPLKWLLSFQFF